MDIKLENILEDIEGDGVMFAQCCLCKRYRLDPKEYGQNEYTHHNPMENIAISHTYCPPCAKKAREEIKSI